MLNIWFRHLSCVQNLISPCPLKCSSDIGPAGCPVLFNVGACRSKQGDKNTKMSQSWGEFGTLISPDIWGVRSRDIWHKSGQKHIETRTKVSADCRVNSLFLQLKFLFLSIKIIEKLCGLHLSTWSEYVKHSWSWINVNISDRIATKA